MVSTVGWPPSSTGCALASAAKYGAMLPSPIGGSGPVSSTVRSSISWAATAARRCSTVWIVASPLPWGGRRSTASTSVRRAGISGCPFRSMRRNTTPCPAGAGRNTASVVAPVWRPVLFTDTRSLMDRLALCAMGLVHQGFQLAYVLREPAQRSLRHHEDFVVARRHARHHHAVGQVADHAALYRHPHAAADGDVIRDADLAAQEHLVAHVRAAGDPRHRRDESALADVHVMGHLDQVVDLGAGPDHRVVHAAAVDRGIGADLHVVPDEAAPHLRDLALRPAIAARHPAEAVGAEARARVGDHAG